MGRHEKAASGSSKENKEWVLTCGSILGGCRQSQPWGSPGSASSVPLPKAAAELGQGRAQEGTGDAPRHRGARARPGNIPGTATPTEHH